jgi:hypothetical protein
MRSFPQTSIQAPAPWSLAKLGNPSSQSHFEKFELYFKAFSVQFASEFVFNSITFLWSAALYGSEAWTIGKVDQKRLDYIALNTRK